MLMMKCFFRRWFPGMLVALVLMGCGLTQQLSPTPRPDNDLPDLSVLGISLQMQGQRPHGCVTAYGPYNIFVTVQNKGRARSPEAVISLSTGAEALLDGLEPGASGVVEFPANALDGQYTLTIDPKNLIAESDESNNQIHYLAPTTTPPALCTPTPHP